MVTQRRIAREASLDVSTVNKILNRNGDGAFSEATVERVLRIARNLGYDFERLRRFHRRRDARHGVSVPTDVIIELCRNGEIYDRGKAMLLDLSDGGARIDRLTLSKGHLPAEPFKVALRPRVAAFRRVAPRGHIRRVWFHDGSLHVAVQFESPLEGIGRLVRGPEEMAEHRP